MGIIGISDNLPGIAFLYLGAVIVLIAGLRGRKHRRKYLYLLIGLVIAFPVTVVLHNLREVGGARLGEPVWLAQLMIGLGVLFFFVAVIFSPAGVLTALLGIVFGRRPRLPAGRC